jgi:hypothetical protein
MKCTRVVLAVRTGAEFLPELSERITGKNCLYYLEVVMLPLGLSSGDTTLRSETPEKLTQRALAYISQTLRISARAQPPREHTPSLMSFLKSAYGFAEVAIADRPYVLIAVRDEHQFPLDYITQHIRRAAEAYEVPAILLLAALTRHRRDQLIHQKIAFVVPGKHLHLPDVGFSLQERCDPVSQPRYQQRPAGALSPTAQALVLRAALRHDGESDFPCSVCSKLGVSFTTTLKAASEVVGLGLADRMRNGQAAPLVFRLAGRALFDAALPYLASPVAWTGYYRGGRDLDRYRIGGEMALARQTLLSDPRLTTYCSFKTPLVSVAYRSELVPCDAEDAEIAVEVWSYDPTALSEGPFVDPLSLYLQYRNNADDRISISAEELLKITFDRGA